jgi:hypothetical protein
VTVTFWKIFAATFPPRTMSVWVIASGAGVPAATPLSVMLSI